MIFFSVGEQVFSSLLELTGFEIHKGKMSITLKKVRKC